MSSWSTKRTPLQSVPVRISPSDGRLDSHPRRTHAKAAHSKTATATAPAHASTAAFPHSPGAYINSESASGAGKSYLILGSTLAAHPESLFDLRDADCAFLGAASGDYARRSLGSAGDVDGDGLDDLVIGSTGKDEMGNAEGKVYAILGRTLAASATASIDLATADFAFIGEYNFNFAGSSVSDAGDVNGDGLDDILIGATGNDEGEATPERPICCSATFGRAPDGRGRPSQT